MQFEEQTLVRSNNVHYSQELNKKASALYSMLTMKTLGLVTTTEEGIFNLLTAGFGGGGGGSGAPISNSRTWIIN